MTVAYLWCATFAFYAAFAAVFGVLYFSEWKPCYLYSAESGIARDTVAIGIEYGQYADYTGPMSETKVAQLATLGLTEDVTCALKTPVQVGFYGYTIIAGCMLLSAFALCAMKYSMAKRLRKIF